MKLFTPFLIFFYMQMLSPELFAQADSLQKQINEQVWKVFINSFNNSDNTGLSSVHSRELSRVSIDNNQIIGYGEYFKPLPDSVNVMRSRWKSNIELRFLQRIASNGRAFETGYYKTTSTNSTSGQSRTGYGKFVVLLRKENGVWKILMDADAHEKTNAEIFMSAKPME
ncbi:MAG TPA: hypothetical protein VK498_15735 [Ferruginibacter sp.]|nr:hypothetical protein [Ferruginibacter sp.]